MPPDLRKALATDSAAKTKWEGLTPIARRDFISWITSPKLALIFGPWSKTEFFVNYGEGFHSNDARGTTTTVSPATGLPVDKVTPLVKTRGGELGARTEIVPGLQSSLEIGRASCRERE